MKSTIIITLILSTLFSCSKREKINNEFSEEIHLTNPKTPINKDYLGRIEGIQSNDSFLITWDYHSGTSFTLFNNKTGKCYGRFGNIGQGPTEIPLPCGGYIIDGKYKIFSCSTGFIAQYPLDSLQMDINKNPLVLYRKGFNDDFFLSAIIPVNDSLYLGAGVYNSRDQYVLFNNKSQIIDSNVLIYNAYNELFGKAQKILSNQGRLTKAPNANKYAYFISNSSNIDFFEVQENRIKPIKLLRERDPQYSPAQENNMKMVFPDRSSSIGYIDITSCDQYVYALHSEKTIENTYSSNIIYVFDWNGNPVKKYYLPKEAYYITVDNSGKHLYTAIKDDDFGWNITSYNINQ